jgi:Tfp pilus assembly protein PilN
MLAFLSRFCLDAQNTDLSDEIDQKQAVIASLSDFEKEFKQTQTKLKIFSELTAREGLTNNAVKTISSNLPPDIFLRSLSFSQKTIYVEGTSPSEISIQQLIVNLDSKDLFKSANLVEMGSAPNDPSLLKFKLDVKIKGKEET